MDIRDSLKQLGLDEKEINVYLACLELGSSAIVPIVNRIRMPRTTVFHILERLGELKLIEIVLKGNRHLYVPYPPRQIVTLLKQQKEDLEGKINTLEGSIPELMKLYHLSPFQPKVRFFQGMEIRKIYEEILETPIDEAYYVGENDKLIGLLGEDYMKKWIERRIKKGIVSKSIRVRSAEREEEVFSNEESYLRKIRYAPEGFQCPTHILIYGDNVVFITTGEEKFGLVITSRETAQSMENWFGELWKISK